MKHHLLDTTLPAEPIDTTHPSPMNLLALSARISFLLGFAGFNVGQAIPVVI